MLDMHINCTSVCACGSKKDIARQWCDLCWDKIPTTAARNYMEKARMLAKQILNCERHIKEVNILLVAKDE